MRLTTTFAVLAGLAAVLATPAWAAKKDQAAAKKLGLKGAFVLAAGTSGKCLSKISGDKLGPQIGAWKCRKKSSNQGFKIKWVDGSWFQLRTAKGNLCIEVSGSSKKNGKPVVQWSCTGKKNQHWKVVDARKRGFQLKARHSGRCLTIDGPGDKISKFSQRKCAAKNGNQRFKVYR